MHLEKLRQQGTRRLRHMTPRSALDLRDIRLAEALAHFLANAVDQFQLRHGTVQSAQRPFHFAQVADFFSQSHISYRNIYIAICNVMSSAGFAYAATGCERGSSGKLGVDAEAARGTNLRCGGQKKAFNPERAETALSSQRKPGSRSSQRTPRVSATSAVKNFYSQVAPSDFNPRRCLPATSGPAMAAVCRRKARGRTSVSGPCRDTQQES